MRIAIITAGAAGMYCGSCMKDNTLTLALRKLGHDAVLIPLYSPITVDEENAAVKNVQVGGINVYLQNQYSWFRRAPRWLTGFLDQPWLLNLAMRWSTTPEYSQLGALTESMLQGPRGHQAAEYARFAQYIQSEVQPDAIILSNVLISGCIPQLLEACPVPTWATLQGDDVFLDQLLPADRHACIELIRQNCTPLTGLFATSRIYRSKMATMLGLDEDRLHVVYPGIDPTAYTPINSQPLTPTIGFLSRFDREKGFHHFMDAFRLHHDQHPHSTLRAVASGYRSKKQEPYYQTQLAKLEGHRSAAHFGFLATPSLKQKAAFYQSLSFFSVPAEFEEPKGLYLLEAWASGIAGVMPARGAFLEYQDRFPGMLLVPPGEPAALVAAWQQLLDDPAEASRRGAIGRQGVVEYFHAARMAQDTIDIMTSRTNAERTPHGLSP
ncbi:MAG: glycosyltransferase family 4 protein [Gemmataceae bacterium]